MLLPLPALFFSDCAFILIVVPPLYEVARVIREMGCFCCIEFASKYGNRQSYFLSRPLYSASVLLQQPVVTRVGSPSLSLWLGPYWIIHRIMARSGFSYDYSMDSSTSSLSPQLISCNFQPAGAPSCDIPQAWVELHH